MCTRCNKIRGAAEISIPDALLRLQDILEGGWQACDEEWGLRRGPRRRDGS